MNQKNIIPKHVSRRSGRIFQYYLPDHWIIRSQEDQEDYGVDFEIQITEKDMDKATIDIFKIQLKGVEKERSLELSRNKAKFSIEVEKLIHYQNLEIPIFLVLVCNENKRVFWVSLQGNKDIDVIIDNASKKKNTTATIVLPNELHIQGDFYDTSQLESKYREVYHYLWNLKSRLFSDYSDDTLNKIDRRCENQLFNVVMERLYRKIEEVERNPNQQQDIGNSDIHRLVDILKIMDIADTTNQQIIDDRVRQVLSKLDYLMGEKKLDYFRNSDRIDVSAFEYMMLYQFEPITYARVRKAALDSYHEIRTKIDEKIKAKAEFMFSDDEDD